VRGARALEMKDLLKSGGLQGGRIDGDHVKKAVLCTICNLID
jgi:hypothetical protein